MKLFTPAMLATLAYCGSLIDDHAAKVQARKEEHPNLQATMQYGWNTSRVTASGNWGFEGVIYADLGGQYSFPLYDEDPYMIQRAEGILYAGSLN